MEVQRPTDNLRQGLSLIEECDPCSLQETLPKFLAFDGALSDLGAIMLLSVSWGDGGGTFPTWRQMPIDVWPAQGGHSL